MSVRLTDIPELGTQVITFLMFILTFAPSLYIYQDPCLGPDSKHLNSRQRRTKKARGQDSSGPGPRGCWIVVGLGLTRYIHVNFETKVGTEIEHKLPSALATVTKCKSITTRWIEMN